MMNLSPTNNTNLFTITMSILHSAFVELRLYLLMLPMNLDFFFF